ncbi:MAG: RusA family crossover junction endodeoxyribonuclease [Thermoguttaceae bacterium]|nr:RusA family crossover junction endodeoxyribonuclease [Thermoguttaceae bacterium]MBR4753059.1 RusA family crossover junction endodeoxyribonuclease [Thermoguttaceae bacterium]MBR5758920.1 RusA family crossover junction endodeoxyribonuclease [Thermoguttaceae bacterium]
MKKEQDDPIEIFIDAMPVSANRIWLQNYKTKQTYLNPKYKVFKRIVQLRCAGTRMPDDWPYCYVQIVVHPKRRSGDADNYTKPILDALTYAGFWDDDKRVADVRSRFGAPDPDKNGCVLIIVERRETKFADVF